MEDSDHENINSDPNDVLDTSKWLPSVKMLTCILCDQKFTNKVNSF